MKTYKGSILKVNHETGVPEQVRVNDPTLNDGDVVDCQDFDIICSSTEKYKRGEKVIFYLFNGRAVIKGHDHSDPKPKKGD